MIGMGQMHDGLYLLQDSSISQAINSLADFLSKHNFKSFTGFCSSTLQNNLFSLWHSRLGHPSDVKVHSLSHVFPFLQHCCTKSCTVCPLAKQKRLPFPFDNKRSSHSFDLVHMDVWGPFSVLIYDGHRFFSHYGWWCFKGNKSDVRAIIVSSTI